MGLLERKGWEALRRRCLAVMLGLVAGLAGCGGGGGDGSSGGGDPPVASPPTVVTQPQPASVPDGSTATFSVVASGTSALSYQWQRNGNAIAGATAASYTTPANGLGDSGSTFSVVVSAGGASVRSSTVALTVNVVSPVVVQPPQPAAVVAGQSVSFTASATGSSPLAYQWHRNGNPIAGATSATLQFVATQADDGARFSVAVSNAGGNVSSGEAPLTVTAAPTAPSVIAAPASLSVNVGQSVSFVVEAEGTAPLSYQWLRNGAAIAGATASSYSAPAAMLADSGSVYAVTVRNAAGDVTSTGATLTVLPPAPAITQQPAAQSVTVGQSARFAVLADGGGTLAYQWRRGGVAIEGATQPSYTLAAATLADHGAVFTVTVSNAGAATLSAVASLSVTAAPEPPRLSVQPQPQTVTAGLSATFSVEVVGTPPFSYQWQRNGSAISGATAASYTTPAAALADSGAIYRVLVGNVTGSTVTSDGATLTVNADGPTITQQPQPSTVLVGRPATFSVAASTSNGPLRYQWRRGGADINGETGPSYTLGRTTFADHGASFSVLVRDARGNVTSNSVALSVTPVGVDQVVGTQLGLLTGNSDGSVWLIWGAPGLNSGVPRTLTPILLRDAAGFVSTGFTQVRGGQFHAVALDDRGAVWAWGNQEYGTLGNGKVVSGFSLVPVQVTNADLSPLTGATAVHAGARTGYALMADGTLRAWGGPSRRNTGAGGEGVAVSRAVPVVDATGAPLTGVVRVVAGPASNHAMALRSDGSLWTWGNPGCAAYTGITTCLPGDGSLGFAAHAVQVRKPDGSAVLSPRDFAPGDAFSVVVQADGTVLAWGANGQGQLGDGTTTGRNGAALLRREDGGIFDGVVAVVTGKGGGNAYLGGCTVLLHSDGSVWATGGNTSGCIGDGTSFDRKVPVRVLDDSGQPLTGVLEISAGVNSVVAKKTDGSHWVWGDITFGSTTTPASFLWRQARRLNGFAP